MKRRLRPCLAALLFLIGWPGCSAESPLALVREAIQRLASQPSYAWVTTQQSESSQISPEPVHGWTEKGGWTYLTSTYNVIKIETVFKGTNSAVKRDGGWQTAAELEAGPNPWLARMLRVFQPPAVEADDLVDKVRGVRKAAGGQYGGELTEAGARSILARRSRPGGSGPTDAKGTVKFWIREGLLVKYQYQLQGTVTREGGEQAKVDRTTTVELKEIGSAKFEVPAEARKRLEE